MNWISKRKKIFGVWISHLVISRIPDGHEIIMGPAQLAVWVWDGINVQNGIESCPKWDSIRQRLCEQKKGSEATDPW